MALPYLATAQSSTPTLASVKATLGRVKQSLRSGRVACSSSSEVLEGEVAEDPSMRLHATTIGHEVLTFDGDKSKVVFGGANGESTILNAPAVGSVLYMPITTATNGAIFMSRPMKEIHNDSLLDYGFIVNWTWAADLLESGSYAVNSASTDSTFGELIHIDGKNKDGEQSITVAAESGLVTVADCTFPDGTRQLWEVQSVERVAGLLLPLRGQLTLFHRVNGGSVAVPWHRFTLETKGWKLGHVDEANFEMPLLVPGSKVKDDKEGIIYKIGPNGERINLGRVGNNADKAASSGVMAYGWVFVASVVSILAVPPIIFVRRLRRNRAGAANDIG